MFKHYLSIAWRNLVKHRLFSLINVVGLAIGLASFGLIMLYVQYELSFDRFHEKADRIYRVVAEQTGNVYLGTDHFAVTQAILATTLRDELPEVLEAVAIDNSDNILLAVGEAHFYENGLIWAGPSIFKVFTFPLRLGDSATALAEPFSIVLSESLAGQYFGDENPLGKTMRYQDRFDLKVTGVMREVPKNSHVEANALVSFATLIAISEYKKQFTAWGSNSYYTYILVPPQFDAGAFDGKLAQIVKKYHTEPWRAERPPHRYYLQRLTDIHLHSHLNFELGQNGDIRYIYLLSGLAIIILLTASINYMNLTTARSAMRAREVGMRKVIGASRLQLVMQFIGEAVLLTLAAAFIALLTVDLLLPAFSKLVERELALGALARGSTLAGFAVVVLALGVVSGSYPALLLAGFQPASVLKGKVGDRGRTRLRSALVVLQCAASVGLIVCTTVVQSQMRYIKSRKLGYNREHVVVMRMREGAARKQFALVKQELLQSPEILGVSASGHLPIRVASQNSLDWTAREGQPEIQSYQTSVDYDFLQVYHIELAEGRNFSPDFSTDSTQAYLINEKLRDLLGWKAAVGKPFGDGDTADGKVIAWPAAYYGMRRWLQDFAYRVEFGWWVFALAGGLALVIALLTVSTQAVKAALTNPVESLRYE